MSKRITIATLAGLLMGLVCWLGGTHGIGIDFSPAQSANVFLQRSVMGFVIGISGLRINWQAHGALIGLIVGSIFALGEYLIMDQLGYGIWVIYALLPLGAIYGWAIELITTKLFNQPVAA